MEVKRTVILGASNNPARYAYLAAHRLKERDHDIIPVGIRKGQVAGELILDIRKKPVIQKVDTITLYMNPLRQQPYYDYILNLEPRRIIFNPGTENPELENMAREAGIETENSCTLVMLSTGIY